MTFDAVENVGEYAQVLELPILWLSATRYCRSEPPSCSAPVEDGSHLDTPYRWDQREEVVE